MLRDAALMLAAGIGIPVLAALNARLGALMGAPVAAAAILFAVAFTAALITMLATGSAGALPRAMGAPPHLFLAGTLVAFYVISITVVAPRFGVGNAIFLVLLGQMIAAAAIDHFALFGALERPLTAVRAAGIAVMAGGLMLIQRG